MKPSERRTDALGSSLTLATFLRRLLGAFVAIALIFMAFVAVAEEEAALGFPDNSLVLLLFLVSSLLAIFALWLVLGPALPEFDPEAAKGPLVERAKRVVPEVRQAYQTYFKTLAYRNFLGCLVEFIVLAAIAFTLVGLVGLLVFGIRQL